MSKIIVTQRRVWTRQPQRPVKLIARGLSSDVVFAAIAGQPESISGVFPVPIGSSSLTVLDQGRGLYSPSTTVGGWSWPVSPSHPIYSITTQHTIVVFGRLDSIALYGNIFGVPHASTWVAPYYAMGISGNSPETTLAAAASVTASLNVASIASGLVTGQETSFAVTRNGTSGAYYRGGALFGSLTWAGGGAINFVNNRPPVLFNRSSSSNGEGVQGSAAAVLVFKRALSADEIARVVENPWQIFAKRDRYAFVNLGGGSSVGLSIADGTHGHISDSLLLSWQDLLTVSDAAHSHSSDPVALSTDWLLSVGNSSHTHAADNLALSSAGATSLSVQDATHAHIVDGITLTTRWLLSIADGAHSHTADNLTLDTSNTTWLTVQDSAHGHASDNLALTLNTWLSIVDAAHAHYADAPTLTAETALQIAEVLHATYADTLVLSLPGAPGSYPTAESIAAAVVAALQGTTIPVDAKLMNGATIYGSGTSGDKWRGNV